MEPLQFDDHYFVPRKKTAAIPRFKTGDIVLGRYTNRKYVILREDSGDAPFCGWFSCMVIEDNPKKSPNKKSLLFRIVRNHQDSMFPCDMGE